MMSCMGALRPTWDNRAVGRPKRLPDDHRRLTIGMHPDLVARLYLESGRRQLNLSDTIRELLGERLDEIDQADQ